MIEDRERGEVRTEIRHKMFTVYAEYYPPVLGNSVSQSEGQERGQACDNSLAIAGE